MNSACPDRAPLCRFSSTDRRIIKPLVFRPTPRLRTPVLPPPPPPHTPPEQRAPRRGGCRFRWPPSTSRHCSPPIRRARERLISGRDTGRRPIKERRRGAWAGARPGTRRPWSPQAPRRGGWPAGFSGRTDRLKLPYCARECLVLLQRGIAELFYKRSLPHIRR